MKFLILSATLVAMTFATPVPVMPNSIGHTHVAEEDVYQSINVAPAIVDGEEAIAPLNIQPSMTANIGSSSDSSIVQINVNLDRKGRIIGSSQSPDNNAPLPTPDKVNIGNMISDITGPAPILENHTYQSFNGKPVTVDDEQGISSFNKIRPSMTANIRSSPRSSILQVFLNLDSVGRVFEISRTPRVAALPIFVPGKVIIGASPVEIGNPELPNPIPSPVIVANPEPSVPALVNNLPEDLK